MALSNITLRSHPLAGFLLLLCMTCTSQAITIDFGVSWPAAFSAPGAYASDPYTRVVGTEGGIHSTTTQIADFLNSVAPTSFQPADIIKFAKPAELGGTDGFFNVAAGYNWLVVQYDGPNGGSVAINLGGNAAIVPYDSAPIWGSNDQYAVSHYSLAGPSGPVINPNSVPDGGATVALMGLGLGAMVIARRKLV